MAPSTYLWLKAAHVIGLFIWLGGLFAVYWLLRFHAHAPKEAHEKLTLMERSLALMMDIGSALAIGTGLAIAIGFSEMRYFKQGWLHIKLAVVVLGVLPVHGIVRARIKKYATGKLQPIPQWMWTMLLLAIVVAVIMVIRGPLMFAK
ncbi:MAG TPA: CopD family protein [Kofleriaceae bacterium]|nr:CopD family protein [Kofleriaceae bacterium]